MSSIKVVIIVAFFATIKFKQSQEKSLTLQGGLLLVLISLYIVDYLDNARAKSKEVYRQRLGQATGQALQLRFVLE